MPSEGNNSSALQQHSAGNDSLPQETASGGNVPQPTASFGTSPQSTAPFGNMPSGGAKTENHILTVKEVARMFEAAGVSRIERTIVNWCHPNQFGIARLDAYYDPNERRHLITPQSVERAIKEEQSRAQNAQPKEHAHKPEGSDFESSSRVLPNGNELEELRSRLRNSETASVYRDKYIATLEQRYDSLHKELMQYSRTVGQLEERLLQLEAPKASYTEGRRIHVVSEDKDSDSERMAEAE